MAPTVTADPWREFTGTCAPSANPLDPWAIVVFGIVGFVLRRHGCPVAPIVPGLILGPMLDTHVRRALIRSRGDCGVFVQRPIAAVLPTVAAVYLLLPLLASAWRRRRLVARA